MADKVIGGTPLSAKSLCANCRWALTARGTNFEEVHTVGQSVQISKSA